MKHFIDKIIVLLALLLVVVVVCYLAQTQTQTQNIKKEGFDNIHIPLLVADSSSTNTHLLPNEMYPANIPGVTNKSVFERNIAKYYPATEVGSYEQKTNNERYPSLPEYGDCTPTEFCNSFYLEKGEK